MIDCADDIVNPSLVAGCCGTHFSARPPRSLGVAGPQPGSTVERPQRSEDERP